MKFKKIVGFGDSWMWGDELLSPELANDPDAHPVSHLNTDYRQGHCFLGLLGKHYDVPTENFGIAGGSLQSTVWNYLWWLKHEQLAPSDCLILIALTDSGRWTFYNPRHRSYSNDAEWNRYVHSSWVFSDATCYSDQWAKTVKDLFALSDSKELRQLQFDQTVAFFDGQWALHQNNLLLFRTMTHERPSIESTSLIWPNQNLNSIIRQSQDYAQYLAPKQHPNEKGHELIAKHLIDYIDSCIIKQ